MDCFRSPYHEQDVTAHRLLTVHGTPVAVGDRGGVETGPGPTRGGWSGPGRRISDVESGALGLRVVAQEQGLRERKPLQLLG
ncbi:hypothetical protein GCM10015535_51180 [Streptomyces gelaticus]|uniref:Uncharacterized protein n=1 Tax=Streptomyces gelaticus TaxID=285446 RepID=A0ABQ2W720_9ACTN|nr:hypothetical protein GCM10015535_51180 [Streptomyces gelaticus]